MSFDFISSYLEYTGDSEVPVSFHRWSAIVGIGAILERNIYINFGATRLHPNQYCMLIGTAGTRKTTAIKGMKTLLMKAGYASIAAERTSKEKFLLDLSGTEVDDGLCDDILERNLFGSSPSDSDIRPMSIMADEANDFFGISNLEFLSILGSMWDWSGPPYSNRTKTGKSFSIANPTITILAGNTPTGFSIAFPTDILGQGFFSRLFLVYGEPNGRKITFPKTPTQEETSALVDMLQQIKMYHKGPLEYTPEARTLLDYIYKNTKTLSDGRFDSYSNRRFVHLLKLCLVVAASQLKKVITEDVVTQTNTYLSYIETLMPKALGEFGKSRNSDITHKILSFIESHDGVVLKDLVKLVSSDLERPSDLGDIIRKLSMSDKIQNIEGLFLPMRSRGLVDTTGTIDLRYLTTEELNIKG